MTINTAQRLKLITQGENDLYRLKDSLNETVEALFPRGTIIRFTKDGQRHEARISSFGVMPLSIYAYKDSNDGTPPQTFWLRWPLSEYRISIVSLPEKKRAVKR